MISNYLKELIENNNRIIIPDFGAFMIQDSPEGKQISFNDFLKFNDGLLVNQIIKAEKISKNQASDMIKEFVKEVEKCFAKNTPFEIAGVGFLTKDNHGNIKFEAKTSAPAKPKVPSTDEKPTIILDEVPVEAKKKAEVPEVNKETKEAKEIKPSETKESIAKSNEAKSAEAKSVEIKTSEAKPLEVKTTDSKTVEPKATETKPLETKSPQKPPIVYSKTDQPPKPTIPPVASSASAIKTPVQKAPVYVKEEKSGSLKVVLISLLVLIVIFGGIGSFLYFDVPKRITSFFNHKMENRDQVTIADSLKQTDTLSVKVAISDSVKEVEEPKIVDENSSNVEADSKKYYIVAGSFKSAGNAERYNKKLTAEGYSSEIVLRSNGFHLVSYKLVYSRSEAKAEWEKMREVNPQVWIYSK